MAFLHEAGAHTTLIMMSRFDGLVSMRRIEAAGVTPVPR